MEGDNHVIYKQVVLAIVDGWGLSPTWGGNAILAAEPPFINKVWQQYPHLALQVLPDSGLAKRIGNSETGHATLGAGRLVYDDLTDINQLIKLGSFYRNAVLRRSCREVKKKCGVWHLVGLLSRGVTEGNIRHLLALIEFAQREGVDKVGLHLVTDGVDDHSRAAKDYLIKLQQFMKVRDIGQILSIVGSDYIHADSNHKRMLTEAHRAQCLGQAFKVADPIKAIELAYKKGYTDANLPPMVVADKDCPAWPMTKNDQLVFGCFRGDRWRSLIELYRQVRSVANIITLTDYGLTGIETAFPPQKITATLAEMVAKAGWRQLRVGETVKKKHLTYYFNGGREESFDKEDRIIIKTPLHKRGVKPAALVTETIARRCAQAISSRRYGLVVVNLANIDCLAHTGNIVATRSAVLQVDKALKQISEAALSVGGAMIITADHGNAEQMLGNTHLQHTANPVPFILITLNNQRSQGCGWQKVINIPATILRELLATQATLADVAPTILDLLGLPKPKLMTGESLLCKII